MARPQLNAREKADLATKQKLKVLKLQFKTVMAGLESLGEGIRDLERSMKETTYQEAKNVPKTEGEIAPREPAKAASRQEPRNAPKNDGET